LFLVHSTMILLALESEPSLIPANPVMQTIHGRIGQMLESERLKENTLD
jgi:hypothetical protein